MNVGEYHNYLCSNKRRIKLTLPSRTASCKTLPYLLTAVLLTWSGGTLSVKNVLCDVHFTDSPALGLRKQGYHWTPFQPLFCLLCTSTLTTAESWCRLEVHPHFYREGKQFQGIPISRRCPSGYFCFHRWHELRQPCKKCLRCSIFSDRTHVPTRAGRSQVFAEGRRVAASFHHPVFQPQMCSSPGQHWAKINFSNLQTLAIRISGEHGTFSLLLLRPLCKSRWPAAEA